jgi:hypothetical protein
MQQRSGKNQIARSERTEVKWSSSQNGARASDLFRMKERSRSSWQEHTKVPITTYLPVGYWVEQGM